MEKTRVKKRTKNRRVICNLTRQIGGCNCNDGGNERLTYKIAPNAARLRRSNKIRRRLLRIFVV